MLEQDRIDFKDLTWYALAAVAALAQAWWFILPGENWLPIMVGPILVAATYNVRRDDNA